MKKNSFKRFLAVTLAAATALTFAPVSTLGLSGVVEAQAAVTADQTVYAAYNATKGTLGIYDGNSIGASAVSEITLKVGDTLKLGTTGLTPNTAHISVTDSNAADDFAAADQKVGASTIDKTATTVGEHVLTIKTAADDVATTDATAKTATLTVNVVTATTAGTGSIAVSDDLLTASAGKATIKSAKFTGKASSAEKFYIDIASGTTTSDNSLTAATAPQISASADTDGVTVYGNTIAISDVNAASGADLTSLLSKVTITAGTSAGNYYLRLWEGDNTISSDVLIASTKITVQSGYTVNVKEGAHGTATVATTKAGAEDDVVVTTIPNDGYTVDTVKATYVNNATPAATVEIPTTKTATNKYKFTVPSGIDALIKSGEDINVTVTFKAGLDSSETTINNTDESKSDIFGGVTTDIVVTDDTDYSLVNADSTFALAGKTYTASQLKWYLTSAPTATPANIKLSNSVAILTNSGDNTAGKLDLHVANAADFKANADNQYIEGVYWDGAQNTIVYSSQIHVDSNVGKTIKYPTVSLSTDSATASTLSKTDLFDGIQLIGVNNKYLKADQTTIGSHNGTGRNFDAVFSNTAKAADNGLKGSTFEAQSGFKAQDGVYVEKYYVPYTDNNTDAAGHGIFVAEISVAISVNAGPKIDVKEGDFVYSNTDGALDDTKVIVLDLSTNKTFDLVSHIVSDKDNTTYKYEPTTQNVSVKDGIVTAEKAGTAIVKITPNANGVDGQPVYVFFRVNQNANDQISVAGKDGDKATVLTTRQYKGNINRLKSEYALVAAQVGYVQIEVNGNETKDVKEALTVKSAGKLTYALAGATQKGESIDAKTGEITIPHSILNSSFVPYVFPVKVTSSETTTSALTTGYFYVVVDYPDAQITGLEDSYEVGTSLTATDPDSWLNLGLDEDYGPKHVSSNAGIYKSILTKDSDLDDSKLYTDDDTNAFEWYDKAVTRATISGKTEHVLVYAHDTANKVGFTGKVVTLKSVAGKKNYVSKIENVATGKTLYESSSAVSGASITIDRTTKVKVTVAYAPDKSLNPKDDPAFTIWAGEAGFNYNTVNVFVAATENPKTYEITLIPSQEGTQIISISPTEGRLSKTDYSLVGEENFNLAVKYDSKALTTKPAKVTGVKVTNKKGAKVTVKFNKVTSYPTIRYYVQKKVGKKVSGKSIGSTKTTLSVGKGKTVKVRVKAYYYDENGSKHVGAYSAWKTLKTDKK